MRKQFTQLVFFVVCFMLLVIPSAVGVSQQTPALVSPPAVAIMVLDRFTSSLLGLDPNAGQAEEFYISLSSMLDNPESDLVLQLQNDPQVGIAQLRELISWYYTDIETRIQTEADETGASGNCIGYLPGLRSDAMPTGGLGSYYINGAGGPSGEAHGVLVSETITDVVDAYSHVFSMSASDKTALADPLTPRPMTYSITVNTQPNPITVIEADTNNFHLASITEKIEDVVSQNPGKLWVINASFAVIPCKDLPELATLEGLIRALYAAHRNNTANLLDALDIVIGDFVSMTNTTTDEVQVACGTNLQSSARLSNVQLVKAAAAFKQGDSECQTFESVITNTGIFVAAAGNSGLPYPFYPASIPSAVSVSASEEFEPFFATMPRDCLVYNPPIDGLCSNAGEVLMPGLVERGGAFYFGTSFAAPRLSLRIAVYLADNNGDSCGLLDIPVADIPLIDLPTSDGRTPGVDICPQLRDTGTGVFGDTP